MKKTYRTNCVQSTGALITALQESGQEITRRTFVRHVSRESLRDVEHSLSYDTGTERGGLRMSKDWHVSYFAGIYDGEPCVYFVHSRIEFIFV